MVEVLTRERVREEGLPGGIRILELVAEQGECEPHPEVQGVFCLKVSEIARVRHRFSSHEPILIHCDTPEGCREAARELARMGYDNLFSYEGEIDELQGLLKGP